LQLIEPIPASYLVPNFEWIRNNEPNEHHNIIVSELLTRISGTKDKVLFISKYDEKIFKKIASHIGNRAYMLDPVNDLSINDKNITQASIQEKISSPVMRGLKPSIGKFDIIVSCRMLEHAHNPNEFIAGLTELLNSHGELIIEIPDSTKPLLQGDVGMLWEEHTNYFTPESIRLGMETLGYKHKKNISYHYHQEDALICFFQYCDRNKSNNDIKLYNPYGEIELANLYLRKILKYRKEIISSLGEIKKKYGDIVIFGAGHRSIMFVNLLNISNTQISFFIDDDINKKKLIIPGANIKILDSNSVQYENIGTCLLAVSIDAEDKIIEMLTEKAQKIIHYYSISPDSKYALSIF
jgi:hypothetical protein